MAHDYQEIDECIYHNKSLGASKQIELMSCDCPRHTPNDPLCGEDSGCVNRLTNIECYGNTLCHDRCTNRRFQNKEFAQVEVFDAGAKGRGVRAKQQIPEGGFVYEYIGEVIDKPRFERRKIQYEKEGVEHFYFMMLQKDEYVDATKKGSVARFLNHSCNPNCAVTKWLVGPKLRMGIFALRTIKPDEELTFDYNADRFGDNVQQCLCGEPNCRGILNGKTDAIDLIPRGVWPILGLEDEIVEDLREQIKSNKAMKKKKELDPEVLALIPTSPITQIDQVNQIVTFLMQPQEEFLVAKVLGRIYSTEAQPIQAQILKMHGYELFGTLLSQYKNNNEMVVEMLKVLEGWPRVTKNKISSSQIEQVVSELASSDNDEVVKQAKILLKEWSELEMAYRIPRQKRSDEDGQAKSAITTPEQRNGASQDSESPNIDAPSARDVAKRPVPKLPSGWEHAYNDGRIYYFNRKLNLTQWEVPVDPREEEREKRRRRDREAQREREKSKELDRQRQEKEREEADLQRIIDAANASGVSLDQPTPDSAKTPNTNHTPKKILSKEEKLERQFTHILAAYVPKVVFKYEDRLDHDRCKKHAKEIVKLLVDKEIRKGSAELELNEAKKKKIKGFISEYVKKLLDRQQSSAGSSSSNDQNRHEERAKKRAKVEAATVEAAP